MERGRYRPAGSTRGSERGARRVAYTYDARGRLLTITGSGYDVAAHGFASKLETRTWPQDGAVLYATRTEFLDAAGQRCRYKTGYMAVSGESARFRRPLRLAYEGYDPAVQGYWAEDIVNTWGEGLNPAQTRWSFRDAEGKPARSPKGYLHADEDYDVKGRLLKITRTGYDGSKGFVTRVDIRYYASDTATKESGRSLEYYDATGQRVEVKE